MIKRAAASLVALALAGGAATWALTDSPRTALPGPAELSVPGTPRTVTLACPPEPTLTIGETTGLAEEESKVADRTRGIIAAGGEASGPSGVRLKKGEPRVFGDAGAHPGTLVIEPGEEAPVATAGYQRMQEAGELSGLILTPCLPAAPAHYLVGGSTATGASSELVLTNLSVTASTVRITVHTGTGTAPASASSTVSVAGGGSETVLLEALAHDEKMAVEVQAEGGAIVAHMFSHEMAGSVGAGADSIEPGADPATEVLVPGLDLSGEHGAPVIRVANPGEATTFTLSVLTDEGDKPVPGAEDVRLAAGAVLDIPLDGLAGGWSVIRVRAQQPVLAAGLMAGDDLAQIPSSPSFRQATATLAAAAGTVVIAAEQSAVVTLRTWDREGKQLDEISETVDGVASFDLTKDVSFIELDASAPIRASLVATDQAGERAGVAGIGLIPTPADAAGLELSITN